VYRVRFYPNNVLHLYTVHFFTHKNFYTALVHVIHTQMETGQTVGRTFSEGFDTQVRGGARERIKKSLGLETRPHDTTHKPLQCNSGSTWAHLSSECHIIQLRNQILVQTDSSLHS